MKHIKKFNESTDYYQRITSSEYRGMIVNQVNNCESFTDKEYWAINDLMKSKYNDLVIELDSDEEQITIHFPYISSDICYIYKFIDEWFYVNISGFSIKIDGHFGGCFKCDQFDGLIGLLSLVQPIKN